MSFFNCKPQWLSSNVLKECLNFNAAIKTNVPPHRTSAKPHSKSSGDYSLAEIFPPQNPAIVRTVED